ncbi:MAG TPA: 2'-5' RNA ligase family protein [Saprospiraceae bacterium]|nr:2'-5' RNA ligase family protein [Saprospiraceae bacterium]
MKTLVIAYPELTKRDLSQIENFRKEHDNMANLIKPHFTLVFPLDNIEVPDLIHEMDLLLEHEKAIPFSMRCAMINKDAFSENYHVFLVPDEGFSQLIKLHDKLYNGLLNDNLRLDIPFIPHITIGSSTDKYQCKKMVDDWNSKDFEINGTISYLHLVKYTGEYVETIESVQLN